MDRRTLLGALGAMTLTGAPSRALAQHQGHGHQHAAKYGALLAAAADCTAKGDVCLAHCIQLMGDGDKSMGECAAAVNQMLALCAALQKLSSQGSPMVPALAKVALDGCNTCAQACKPHIEKHAECKACRDSCLECAKQCKAVI